MINPVTKITISQSATVDLPNRNQVFLLNGVTEGEITSNWKSLTDKARIVFPKNIYVSKDRQKVTWGNKDIIGGDNPIMLRGDKIKIELGYRFKNEKNEWDISTNVEFEGFISKVVPRNPIELECEDNMWLLKQTQIANKSYYKKTVQEVLTDVLRQVNAQHKTSFTVRKEGIETNLGTLVTQNETACQLLDRLKKDYPLDTYFKGEELVCSGLVYYSKDAKDVTFTFQKDIIEDNLEFVREDDVRIGVKAISVQKEELGHKKDGSKKTRTKRMTVNVGATDGEIRTIHFWDAKNETELRAKANDALRKLTYEGLKGSITCFAMPFVKFGDNIKIVNKELKEYGGTYKCKAINTTFGMDGLFRKIELDFKIDVLGIDL